MVLATPVRQQARSLSQPPSRRPRLSRRSVEAITGYTFVAPAVLGFVVFVVGPLVGAVYFSTLEYNTLSGRTSFAGLGNYTELATSGAFAVVLRNTAVFSLAVIPGNLALGLLLAVLLNQRLPGIGIFRTVYFLPAVMSLVAWSLVWEYMLQANGGVNAWLSTIGISGPNWLADPAWAMASLVAVQVIKGVGISTILFLAALQDLPEEVLEAGRLDGASRLTIFTRLSLPLISPTLLLVSILATINALKAFAQVFLLTEGGPGISTSVLGYYIYDQAFNAFQLGRASAAAVVLFVIVLTITLIQWLSRKKWVFNE